MPFPLASHHVQLVAACYPPSAALLTSGPDYKPNSQELSRLTYYASNRPGKVAKLSGELEKRVLTDARKAKSGNAKTRASLLITLNIFKALTTECRRDLSLLSTSLMSALDSTLAALSTDLEVAAKVASVFTAWTTYTNGQLLGVDQTLTRDYVSTMRRFSAMCLVEAKNNDYEDRNRTRLVGLGALTGAVASEALYNSSSQFKSQVFTIIPALLLNILQTDIAVLDHESESSKDYPLPLTPYLSDFRSRPLLERRAASIHVHIDGDEGPSMGDVANVALKAFACLLSQSNGTQVGHVLQAVLNGLDVHDGWKDVSHCCWLAQKAVEWTPYQYRFAIPTRLVERILEAQDDPFPSDLHKALTAMIKTVLTAPIPLINLSTSDICSNLTALILRKVAINPRDNLLPELVECVGSLGTHMYYADQIHDLACEIIGRLINIESNGIGGKGRSYGRNDEERATALRCLVAALGQLIRTSTEPAHSPSSVDGHDNESLRKIGATPAVQTELPRPTSPKSFDDATSVKATLPQRSKIPPDVWQETLTLLCDENAAVRNDYVRTLVLYLKTEIRRESGLNANGDEGMRALIDGPFQRARSLKSVAMGDSSTSRFLHALHASLYILATSPRLGLPPSSPPSPTHSADAEPDEREPVHVNIIPSTPLHNETFSTAQDEHGPDVSQASQASQSSRRKSATLSSQTRKLHKIRRLLDAATHQLSLSQTESEASSACLSDYLHILSVLDAVHEQSRSRALMTGLPMLLALRSWCETECRSQHRRVAIRQVLVHHWQSIARVWDSAELRDLIKNAETAHTPSFPHPLPSSDFPSTEDTLPLSAVVIEDNEQIPQYDGEAITAVLASNVNVQIATGLDESGLKKRLGVAWTPESAMRDSIEHLAGGDASRSEHNNPVLKISPALMHISNLSLQSLTRSNRGVGVNDLRETLEGRGGGSSLALSQGRAPSIASLGLTHSGASGESGGNFSNALGASRSRARMLSGENTKDVRDVLDKLGIGMKGGANLHKAPLSARQPSNTRSVLIPPYAS